MCHPYSLLSHNACHSSVSTQTKKLKAKDHITAVNISFSLLGKIWFSDDPNNNFDLNDPNWNIYLHQCKCIKRIP